MLARRHDIRRQATGKQGDYALGRLRWTDRKGANRMVQGNVAVLAKRMESIRCEAKLELLDGTLVGSCTENLGQCEDRRKKWLWSYDPALLHRCICLSNSEPQYHQRECPVYRAWKEKQ